MKYYAQNVDHYNKLLTRYIIHLFAMHISYYIVTQTITNSNYLLNFLKRNNVFSSYAHNSLWEACQ